MPSDIRLASSPIAASRPSLWWSALPANCTFSRVLERLKIGSPISVRQAELSGVAVAATV
jgi:hypothetical protein